MFVTSLRCMAAATVVVLTALAAPAVEAIHRRPLYTGR